MQSVGPIDTLELQAREDLLTLRSTRIWDGLGSEYFSGTVSVRRGSIVDVSRDPADRSPKASSVIDYGEGRRKNNILTFGAPLALLLSSESPLA